jgi:hypothetical protein
MPMTSPGFHFQADAVQHRRRFRAVAECHLVQCDVAFELGQLGGAGGGHFGAGVEDVAQAGHGDAGLLEVGPQLGHAHDGLAHALGEHIEGDELADRQLVVHHQMGAVPQGGGVDQLADEVDAFMRHRGQVLGFEAGGYISGQLAVPAFGKGGLQRGGLYRLDAGDGFDQHGLVFCTAGEFDVQAGAQDGDDCQGSGQSTGAG